VAYGMTHTIEADLSSSLFVVTTEGEGSEKGVIAFLKDIIAHPEWRPGLNILLDHRRLTIDKIKEPGVKAVSMFFISISKQLGWGKLALVMNRDVDFGITRAWEIITADSVDMRIRVFRSYEEGRNWVLDPQA
jgi:hypothetical protein